MKQIEINGVKLEFDERTATNIETYKVGDRVKVLIKSYGNSYNVYPGVIIGFSNFSMLPTIDIMYVDRDRWESDAFKFASLNAKSEDIEIAPFNDVETLLDKQSVLDKIDSAIRRRELELDDMKLKRTYFIERFAKAFEPTQEQSVA